jgi:hypothetical protein
MLDACVDTGMTSQGLLMIDGTGQEYDGLRVPPNWSIIASMRHLEFCGMLRLALALCPTEPFYGLICDDDVPRTRAWDLELERAAGAWKIACAHNLHCSPPRLGAGVFGGDLVRTVGWWAPSNLIHLYFDDVWEHLHAILDVIRFCPGVLVEHLHFSNGKAPSDKTYERVYEGESYSVKDRVTFETWRAQDAREVIERVQNVRRAVNAIRN